MAKSIDILFGVKGGASVSGESGAEILKAIQGIVSEIEQQGVTKLKFTPDTSGISAGAQQTVQSMQNMEAAIKANKVAEAELKVETQKARLEQQKTNAARAETLHQIEQETAAHKKNTWQQQEEARATRENRRVENQAIAANIKNMKKYQQLGEIADKYKSQIKSVGMQDEVKSLLGKFRAGDFTDARNAEIAFDEMNKRLREAGVYTDTFSSKVRKLFGEHFDTAVAMVGVHALQQAVQQLYQNVVALDRVTTDLQIATGMSRSETKELVSQYSELGQELGATTADTAKAADTWLRQGKDLQETQELVRQTMYLSKLGQIDSEEAATALTSALKGYKLEAADAASVVDKLVSVDMLAAASSGGIATAMSECANSANIAGVSMDKLIGYLTVVKEVTQDGDESVGKFAKTMFARMGNIKSGRLEDPETGESLSDVETVLSNLGIKLRDSNSEFRNFGDVLDEVASKWDSYNSVQQHAIAQAFGNTRNQEKFLVLMENYKDALSYTETAEESAGTAAAKYEEAYMSSIEAAQNRLMASFESMSTAALDGGLVAGLMDIANALTKILTPLVSIIGIADGLPVKIAAFIAIISLLNKTTLVSTIFSLAKGTTTLSFSVNNLLAKLISLNSQGLMGIISSIPSLIVGLGSLITKFGLASVAGMNFKGILDMLNINPIMLAISTIMAAGYGIYKAIDYFTTTPDEWKEKASEIKQEASKLISETDNLKTELESVRDKIAEIQAKGTLSLTDEAELSRLKRENAELQRKIELNKIAQQSKVEDAKKAFSGSVSKWLEDGAYYFGVRQGDPNAKKQVYERTGIGVNKEAERNILDYVDDYIRRKQSGEPEQYLESIKEDIEKKASEYQTALDTLFSSGYTYGSDKEIDAYIDRIESFLDRVLYLTQGAEGLFDQILNRDKFEEARTALEGLSDSGEMSAESLRSLYDTNENVKAFVDYLVSVPGMVDWKAILGEDDFKKYDKDSNGFIDSTEASAAAGANLAKILGWVSNEFQTADKEIEKTASSFASTLRLTKDQAKQIEEGKDAIGSLSNALKELESQYSKIANGNVDVTRLATTSSILKKSFSNGGKVAYSLEIIPETKNGDALSKKEIENYLSEIEQKIKDGASQSDILEWDKEHKGLIVNIHTGVPDDNDEALEKLKNKYSQLAQALSTRVAADNIKEIQDAATKASKALKQVKEDGSLSNDSLLSIYEAFGETEGFEKYIGVLTDTSASYEDLQNALNGLYSEYIQQSAALDNLNSTNAAYIEAQLKAAGVTNAHEVVTMKLKTSLENFDETRRESIKNILVEQGANDTLISSYNQMATAYINAQNNMSQVLDESVKARISAMGIELDSIKSVGDAYSAMIEAYYQNARKDRQNTAAPISPTWFKNEIQKGNTEYVKKILGSTFGVDGDKIVNGILASAAASEQREKLEALLGKLIHIDPTVSSIPDFGSSSSKNSKKEQTAGEKASDAWSKYYKELKHKRDMNLISDKQYYNTLAKNYRGYLKNYEETADTVRSVQEEIYDNLKKLYKEDLEKQKDALQKKKDQLKDYYDKQKQMIEDSADAESEKKKREEYAKELGQLEHLISILKRDTTQEAKRQLAEAQDELAQKQKEYDDWEKSNAKDKVLDALDKEYEQRSSSIDAQVEKLDTRVDNIDNGVGNIYKTLLSWAKSKGYRTDGLATGTDSASGGWYRTQENGPEAIGLNMGNGDFTYLTPKSKVWNASATEVLYHFANSPLRFLSQYAKRLTGTAPSVQPSVVSVGDIVIHGNADSSTVAALRKERDNITYTVLQGLKKIRT